MYDVSVLQFQMETDYIPKLISAADNYLAVTFFGVT
jgi:hypothetical protein